MNTARRPLGVTYHRQLILVLFLQLLLLAQVVVGQTDREAWRYSIPGFSIVGLAAAPDGTLYITANNQSAAFPGTNNSRVVALKQTGEVRWISGFGEMLAGPPVVSTDGRVYCTHTKSQVTGLGYVVALNENGESLWELSGSSTFQPPAIATGGDLYVINESTAYIVRPDGTVLWSPDATSAVSTPANSAPPILEGKKGVWVGTSAGVQLYAVGGPRIWRNDSLGSVPLGMAPSDSNGIYVTTLSGLFAYRSDGTERWRIPSTNFSSGPVLGVDGTLYVGTSTNSLVAIAPNGNQIWAAPLDSAVSTSGVVGEDGGVFLGTKAGGLVALNGDGSARWDFTAGSSVMTAPALSQGLVVFGTADGTVWALHANTGLGMTPWPKYQRDNLNQGRADYGIIQPGVVSTLAAVVQSPGGTVIHIDWQSAEGAWIYEVWRAIGDDLSKAEAIATNVTGVLKFDDDLTRAEVSYSYWVRGANPDGVGLFSGPVSAMQTNQLWAAILGDQGLPPVIGSNGNIYATAWKGGRYSLAAYEQSGSPLWRFEETNRLWKPSLAPNGNLIVQSASDGGSVFAITSTGTLAWSARLQGLASRSPSIDAYGTVYMLQQLAPSSSALAAISSDGVLLWNRGLSGDPTDHAVIGSDGTAYAGTTRALYAKNPDGSLRWAMDSSSPQRRWEIPAINQAGEVVAAMYLSTKPYLLRVKADSTTISSNIVSGISWDASARREPVIAADGTSFFVGDSALICFDPTGKILWTNRFQTSRPDPSLVPALDSLGNIYVVGQQLVSIIHKDGSDAQKLELAGTPVDPPVLSQDGRIYITAKGRLYALRALAGLDTKAPWPMYRHDPSGTGCAQNQLAAPNQPTLRPVTPFANRVRIQCEPTAIPSSLELFRSTTTNFQDAVQVAHGRSGELFADDTTAIPGVVYHYWARQQNAGGTSVFSGPVSASSTEVPVKWFSPIPNLGAPAPAISPDGTVYTCATNLLVALNADGSTRWQLPGYNGSPMVGPDGALIIRSGDRVTSLSREAATNWVVAGVATHWKLIPAVDAVGNVIIPYTSDTTVGVSATGSNIWQRTYTNYPVGLPSITHDGTTILLRGSDLMRLNPDGSEAGGVPTPWNLQNTWAPILDLAGTVYLPDLYGTTLLATSVAGTNLWTLPSSRAVQTCPVVGQDGTVFVGYSVATVPQPGPHLTEVGAVVPDGSFRWKFATGQAAWPSLAVSANNILFVAVGPDLYALACETGRVLWQVPSPNLQNFGPPVLDQDGTLYAPVAGGILALRTGGGPAPSAWPMLRQNARQSACIQQTPAPQMRAVSAESGSAALELNAHGGAVILQSPDLREWNRLAFQPPTNVPTLWPINCSNGSQMFFRAVSP